MPKTQHNTTELNTSNQLKLIIRILRDASHKQDFTKNASS